MINKLLNSVTPNSLAKYILIIFLIAISIILASLIFYFYTFYGALSHANDVWGQFGDFFGGTVNPLLSFLSLMALLLTIALQSKEQERAASYQEKIEKNLNDQQVAQLKKQFEGTFFSLLDQHNRILEKISTSKEKWSDKGSDISQVHRIVLLSGHSNLEAAKQLLGKNNDLCGHYFRNLYQLLKFVALNRPGSIISNKFTPQEIIDSEVSHDEKMYTNIVRSFVSNEVTQLLAVNCFSKDENDIYWRYKLLIERYEFLEHMSFNIENTPNRILDNAVHHYKKSAFGRSVFLEKPGQ